MCKNTYFLNLTNADSVNESVEMKWRKIRLYTKTQRLFSRKYQVLIEEVYLAFIIMNICSLFYMIDDAGQ